MNIVRYTESMHECTHFFFAKFSLARSFLVSPFPSHNFWRRFTEYSIDYYEQLMNARYSSQTNVMIKDPFFFLTTVWEGRTT